MSGINWNHAHLGLLILAIAASVQAVLIGDVQVRLVGGSSSSEGRVEVRRGDNDTWGTVCDDQWGQEDATVVCRQLGLGKWGEAKPLAAFGEGEGPIYLNNVDCAGTETSLAQCQSDTAWGRHNCIHDEDAGVVCHQYLVKLMTQSGRFNTAPYGSVQFLPEGTSQSLSVCDGGWDDMDAKVACRMAGYVDGAALCCGQLGQTRGSYYGSYYYPYYYYLDRTRAVTNMTCTGTEASLSNCTFNYASSSCTRQHRASVICYSTPQSQVDMSFAVRLHNSSRNWGMVEVRHRGVWGVVCPQTESAWNDDAAAVFCKQLGHAGGVRLGRPDDFNIAFQGSGWITGLNCTGRETSLDQCNVTWGQRVDRCRPSYALCYTRAAPKVRLVGGDQNHGRVEVEMDGVTYRVCDDRFHGGYENIVCRQLHFSGGSSMSGYYGKGSGDFALSGVWCNGNEKSLWGCQNRGWLQTGPDCNDDNRDASVLCYHAVGLDRGDHSTGMLLVNATGRHTAVCGTGFDDSDARVACREMGFENGYALPPGAYGRYYGDRVFQNLTCTGNEDSIFNCSYDSRTCPWSSSYTNYAAVACYNGTRSTENRVWLEDGLEGLANQSGRVVVEVGGLRGKLCPSIYWDDNGATVLCKNLTFTGGKAIAMATAGQGPYLLNDLQCYGNESSLLQCPSNEQCSFSYSSPPSVGVLCYRDNPPVVQLVGGASAREGRVEVVFGERRGTVCAIYRQSAAKTVCKQFGHVDGTPINVPRGTGDVAVTDVRCSGSEKSVFMCRSGGLFTTPSDSCADHSRDLGVSCHFEVRLAREVQKNDTVVGIVQLYQDSNWLYMCSQGFDERAARVTCRRQGYMYSRVLPMGALDSVYYWRDAVSVSCTGGEGTLANCSLTTGRCVNPGRNYSDVLCSRNPIPTGMSAVNPDNQPGHVKVKVYGVDSYVCADSFDDEDADVYCRELGYRRAHAMGAFRHGFGDRLPLIVGDLGCRGNEGAVAQCARNVSFCASGKKARVYCYNDDNDLKVRFVGDVLRHYGRVEVSVGGEWGSVCDNWWTDTDADVVCRSQGYSGGEAAHSGQYGPATTERFFLNSVTCNGDETSIWKCPLFSFNTTGYSCNRYTAAVMCTEEVKLWPNATYGALQVLVDNTTGQYGLVCSDNFTDTEALVACNTIGLEYGIHMCCSAYGLPYNIGRLRIMRTKVKCTGRESMLSQCEYDTSLTYCPSGQYASVVCSNTPATSGYRIRVDTVRDTTYGRVLVEHMGYWGYICPDGFDDKDANVVCRESGYTGGVALHADLTYHPDPSASSGLRWLSGIECGGRESSLARCPGVVWGDVKTCNRKALASVICYMESAPQLRIVNGTANMGRLEVWSDNSQGSVCGRHWYDSEARVACRELAFNDGRTFQRGIFGKSSAPALIEYVHCSGNETSLLTCFVELYGMQEHDTNLCEDDATVQCFRHVRITGSQRPDYGRVEVFDDQKWLPLCEEGFDVNAAQVVCREIGYTHARPQCCSALGPLSRRSQDWYKVIRCSGSESTLLDCEVIHNSDNSTCPSGRYASVLCSNDDIVERPLQVRLAATWRGEGVNYGGVEVNRYGFWGAVCNSSWDDRDANATCHALNYTHGVTFYGRDRTRNPMVVGSFNCTGREASLGDCRFGDIDDDLGCSLAISQSGAYRVDAGVLCSNTPGTRIALLDGGANWGRVAVIFDGQWGRVVDRYFSQTDINVVCRQLGYFAGSPAPYSMRKYSTGKTWMYYVRCGGEERTLFECYSRWNYRPRYSYRWDANVICHGSTRLLDGNSLSVGRVEVSINGKWGAVCDTEWTDANTRVTCRQLGYSNGSHLCCNAFGNRYYPLMDHVRCVGSESELSRCPHSAPSANSYVCQNSVAVACWNGTAPSDYTYDLRGGPTNSTGEVTVTYLNMTGRVCSAGWDDKDAKVFCRELGFEYGRAYHHFLYASYYYYSGTTGPFWMSEVNCAGNEMSLRDCHKKIGPASTCSTGTAAGVMCTNEEGIYYRLGPENGESGYRGRVEIMVNNQWGTVCGRYFDYREAIVFCRSLGFDDGRIDYRSTQYPDTPTRIYHGTFQCTGQESILDQCPHQGIREVTPSDGCTHSRDANVICYNDIRIGGAYDPNIRQGPVQIYRNGTWYNLCDTGFNDDSARRVCRDLEFADGKAVCCSAYGSRSYYVWGFSTHFNYTLRCDGQESSAAQCIREENCDTHHYASVVCFNETDFQSEDYTFDLVGGSNTSGQVAVTHYGVTGRVCNTLWDDAEARVLCRSRGQPEGLAFHYSQRMYQSFTARGPFWMSGLNCTGNENSLADCPFSDRLNLGDCGTADLAGAICLNTSGIQYRISDPANGQGRVDLSVGGVWGTVCDYYWDDREAGVLCRSLNYSDGYAVRDAFFGQGTGPMWLSYLHCKGDEVSLDKCPHAGFKDEVVDGVYYYGCRSHSHDASVVCVDKLKLSLGLNASMGAVMVYRNNGWSLVCDSGFSDADAKVVCRTFNYRDGVSVAGGVFGMVDADIGIANVQCTGREKTFAQCSNVDVSTACPSGKYASVICSNQPFVLSEKALRLVSDVSGHNYHGKLQAEVKGVWGEVCAAGFDKTAATVACRELGFTGGVPYRPFKPYWGPKVHSLPILMQDVRCNGQEQALADCSYTSTSSTTTTSNNNNNNQCDYSAPRAGVLCYNGTAGVSYRLAGDSVSTRGRFEMSYAGQWGLVCASWATPMAARVACTSVGYKDGLTLSGARYTSGTNNMPVWFSYLSCQGNESSVAECQTRGFNTSYYYHYACRNTWGPFSVECYNTQIAITQMRLVGGPDRSSGRVEVFVTGPNKWGTICDDYWADVDATVVCRQLGYSSGKAHTRAFFGMGSGPIWLDDVGCVGTEERLQDCPALSIGDHNCRHSEDVGVTCSGVYVRTTTSRPTPPPTKTPKPTRVTPSSKPSNTPEAGKQSQSEQTGDSTNTAAIVVPVIIIVIIVVVVAVVFVQRRRRSSFNKFLLTSEGMAPAGRLTFGRGGVVKFRRWVSGMTGGGEREEGGITNPTYECTPIESPLDSSQPGTVSFRPEQHADYSGSTA